MNLPGREILFADDTCAARYAAVIGNFAIPAQSFVRASPSGTFWL
jgi:hypothetical protein